MPKLTKPSSVANSPFKSAKWDEIVAGREFLAGDIPTLTMLCSWYEVVERCIEDISTDGGVQVAYSNDMNDIKALPQLSVMKQASAEIRALNKQLGIDDRAEPTPKTKKASVLKLVVNDRKKRAHG